MDEESSCISVTKTWGFRRSTIARREFMEAVGSMDISPPVQRRRARQSRGRGKGRGRGKRVVETSLISLASNGGHEGQSHALEPMLTPANEKSSSGNEAQVNAEGIPYVAAELKSVEESVSEGVISDRAEDSDDLNLQEIRKRAVARRLQELSQGDNGAVKGTEDMDVESSLLMKRKDVSMLDPTAIAAKEEKVCSFSDSGASGNVTAAGARKAIGGRRRAKQTNKDSDEELQAEEEDDFSKNTKEDTERVDQNAVCCTCQQRHNNGSMICCDSCREWRHVNCAGVTEGCGRLLQRPGEAYICPSCSDDQEIMRKINGLNKKHNISSCNVVGIEPLEEKAVKVERAAFPKCIGPGCHNDALPESVYCGHQCIVQHAAVAMKSLSDTKIERKPAAPPDPSLKSEKRSFLAKLFKVKVNKTPAQEEHVSKQEEMNEESLCSATVIVPVRPTASSTPAIDYKLTIKSKDDVESSTSKPQSQSSGLTQDIPSSGKTPAAPLIKKSTPGRAKKTMPGSPRLELLKGAQSKSLLTFLKKPPETKTPPESSKPPEFVTCRASADDPVMAPHSSPLLIRQNIRHSLSESLLRRLNQSDDLNIGVNDIEKLAADVEKEMFNMCYTTDEDYKNKCQYLILSLNDPKNKELCLQVLKGNMPSIKLVHLSQQRMTFAEETTAEPELQICLKKEQSYFSFDIEEPQPPPEKLISVKTTESIIKTAPPEEKSTLCPLKQTPGREKSSDAPDMIGGMLKDSTSEHKRHFFDLNCRICTGQVSTDDPETKKPKLTGIKDCTEKERSLWVVHMINEALDSPALDSNIIESPASPNGEDLDSQLLSSDFSPVMIPSIPLVSISGRDPRTAQYQKALSLSAGPELVSTPLQHLDPAKNVMESLKEIQPPHESIHLPAQMPKSILMKPSPSSLNTLYGSTTRLADCDKGTAQFLSKQSILWKGFLNMPTVAKFVTKGYLISGSHDFLKEDLPDTIHIGGRILPQTVWDYVDLIKTSEAKELSLIRFHPASEEEEVAYVSLFSYFNSRRRFGVVSNICKHIKDLYLIPLCAKQSIPAVLLPIDGPGLEQNHPNLLIGLAVCQKLKRPEGLPQDVAEKKSRSFVCKEISNPTSQNDLDQDSVKACDADIVLNSNPCDSLPSVGLPDVSCSASPLCGPYSQLSVLSVSKPTPFDSAGLAKDYTNTTPLETILNTLFGQKKQLSDVTECKISSSTDDVHLCKQMCKEDDIVKLGDDSPYDPEDYDPAICNRAVVPLGPAKALELKVPSLAIDDDDRPYDPEEEYSAVDHGDTIRNKLSEVSEANIMEETSTVNSDVAYDPEDETVFEEMQNYLTSNAIPLKFTIFENSISNYKDNIATATLSEQQKILEELNRQIEEQKRQLEEQTETLRLRKEAIGVSMAHFSVSNALMSPPTQFDRDEETEKTPYFPVVIQNKDPRICRKTNQDVPFDDGECEAIKKESVQKLLHVEETKNVVHNKSLVTTTETLSSHKAMPKEGSQKNAHRQNTKLSHLENTYKKGARRSTLRCRSSSSRSWHEHRSYHRDRISSVELHKVRSSKNISGKHHKSRQSAENLSRRNYSDRKRVTSSRKRDHHHHRDSRSPSRYRRNYSVISHSSRRDKSLQDDSDQSRKTEQHLPGSGSQLSHRKSDQVPGCDNMQSVYTSGQSVQVQDDTTNCKDKELADVQQDGTSTTKREADKSQGLQTLQHSGKDCSQPVLNKSFDKNQLFSRQSEIKRANFPPYKTDLSSKHGPLLHSGNVAHGATDLPLHRLTPALKQPKIQTNVFHYDSLSPSTQPPHNQTGHFSETGQISQKRGMPSTQSPNCLHDETEKMHSVDYPQTTFRSQYRYISLSDTDQFYCRELPQDKRRDCINDIDPKNQTCISHEQEGLLTWEHSMLDHQKHQNHTLRGFSPEETDQDHQSQQPNFQESKTGTCHKKCRSYMQGQNFYKDKNLQFQKGESLLGSTPVQHKDFFRPPNPREYFQPSSVDDQKQFRERPSVPVMKLRSPNFGQTRDANVSTLTDFGPRGQSTGFVMYEGQTKDPQLQGPFREKMFESTGSSQTFELKDPSPGMRSHRGSSQVMHDRSKLQLNSAEQVSISNVEGPSARQIDTRGSQMTITPLQSHMLHLTNPNCYRPVEQFHKGKSVVTSFSNKQTEVASGHASPQDFCEIQNPNCHQTLGEAAEDKMRTCFSRQTLVHSQDPECEDTLSQFEGQQYTEIKGQRRGLHKSRFIGQKRGIVGTFFSRHHKINSQMTEPRFDSPQQFLGQRGSSADLHKHQSQCEVQNLGQQHTNFEWQHKQTNIRPLRLSGPLLPTPPGGPIKQNISQVHRHNSHNECDWSQGRSAIRQRSCRKGRQWTLDS